MIVGLIFASVAANKSNHANENYPNHIKALGNQIIRSPNLLSIVHRYPVSITPRLQRLPLWKDLNGVEHVLLILCKWRCDSYLSRTIFDIDKLKELLILLGHF